MWKSQAECFCFDFLISTVLWYWWNSKINGKKINVFVTCIWSCRGCPWCSPTGSRIWRSLAGSGTTGNTCPESGTRPHLKKQEKKTPLIQFQYIWELFKVSITNSTVVKNVLSVIGWPRLKSPRKKLVELSLWLL